MSSEHPTPELVVMPWCDESNGVPVMLGDHHVATFSLASEANEYVSQSRRIAELKRERDTWKDNYQTLLDVKVPQQSLPTGTVPVPLAAFVRLSAALGHPKQVETERASVEEALIDEAVQRLSVPPSAPRPLVTDIVDLIRNDSYAVTFQSMGEYRSALVRHTAQMLLEFESQQSVETVDHHAPDECFVSECHNKRRAPFILCDEHLKPDYETGDAHGTD